METAVLRLIGSQIRDIRKSKEITQEQLAEMAETHHSYIGGLERGERNATIHTLMKIANALEVEFFELFQSGFEFSKFSQKHKLIQDILQLLIDRDENDLRKAYKILAEVYKR